MMQSFTASITVTLSCDVNQGFDGIVITDALDMKAIVDLHKKADGLEIDRFLLPVGNDGLNSEGYSRATTKGTPQQDHMLWRQSFRGYWHLVMKSIDYLAQFAPVDVVVVQGNHDFERMFYVGEVLDAMYHKNKNVNIVFTGNVGEAQNFDNIFKVARELKDKKNLNWTIIGTGRKLEEIKIKIEQGASLVREANYQVLKSQRKLLN